MQGLSTPLVVAAAAFLLVMLWRVRPAFPGSPRRASREALREAKVRAEAATDPAAKALALCDAADLTPGTSAKSSLFLRALRADPKSPAVVARAVVGLGRRPRALESFLWRTLAQGPIDADSKASARAALEALSLLNEGPVDDTVRARAFAHLRDAI
jgi:hypothetical protein